MPIARIVHRLSLLFNRPSFADGRWQQSAIVNHQSSFLWHAHPENCKVWAVEPAQIATRTSFFLRQVWWVVPMAVELLRKSQDFRWAEIDAKAAAFATVPINKDLTAELSCFRCCGSLRHLNLDGRTAFSEPGGANCPQVRKGAACLAPPFPQLPKSVRAR